MEGFRMSILTIENRQEHWSNLSMQQLMENKLKFEVGPYVFFWDEQGYFHISGGFIDPAKKFYLNVLNKKQVIAAVATKNAVTVKVGYSCTDVDIFEICINFHTENVHVVSEAAEVKKNE